MAKCQSHRVHYDQIFNTRVENPSCLNTQKLFKGFYEKAA